MGKTFMTVPDPSTAKPVEPVAPIPTDKENPTTEGEITNPGYVLKK